MNKSIFKSIGAVLGGFIVIVILSIITDTVFEQTGVLPREKLFDTGQSFLLCLIASAIP
jgi:hypothetical protein